MRSSKLTSTLVHALFGHDDRRAPVAQIDDGCPVCDHPFGHMAHMCLSSGSSVGIAS